jgi:uncharacterized protein YjdB
MAAVAGLSCSDFTAPDQPGSPQFIVRPRTAQLTVGDSVQLAARNASGIVIWSSSDKTIATVNFGRVVAVDTGTVTIRAVSGTSTAVATITVTAAP